jgi:hypothetical protein
MDDSLTLADRRRTQTFGPSAALVYFGSIDANVFGRRNTKAHALALYFGHFDSDVAADDNFLARSTCQYEHQTLLAAQ